MQYYFESEIAEKFSVEEAIFVHSVHFWCWKNECNGKNFSDGRYWTYNTAKALAKLFPFWSPSQINRIIEKCKNDGLILVKIENKKSMDRTRSFAITDFVKSIYRNRDIDLPNSENSSDENGKCYKEQLGTQIGTQIKAAEPLDCLDAGIRKQALAFVGDDDDLLEALDGFCQMRKKKRNPITTARAMKLTLNRLNEYSGGDRRVMVQLLDNSTERGWTSIYEPKKSFLAPEPEKKKRGDLF
ncbi:hypothetical protein [Butyricicoccus porcorum]|uniref:Uncharacterized protein n=1 Tax=Butyricicoccus porcorum TaxID=1945634 RepID=A0A252F2R7_9FIRM|nr:hypothetical protein [Butyricicoccus porcorum]OUM20019.1 hypothetical protein CBW42_09760 [Butyricicoccus porcorum]